MARFRNKPVEIEAVQWNGKNVNEVRAFMQQPGKVVDRKLRIQTLEGSLYASEGDWIVKDSHGECWPVRDDIFAENFESMP